MLDAPAIPAPAEALPADLADRPEACAPEPEGEAPPDAAALQAARQLAALEELREIGMDLARALGRQVTKPATEEEARALAGIDLGLAFARISRAVRQIIAMEQEIMGLRETCARQIIAAREARAQCIIDEAAERERQEEKAREAEIQRSIRRAVKDSIRADKPGISQYGMRLTMARMFNDYDDYDDYVRGTPAEIVTRICADLGIEPDLSIWMEPDDAPPDEDHHGDTEAQRDEAEGDNGPPGFPSVPLRLGGQIPQSDLRPNGHDPP